MTPMMECGRVLLYIFFVASALPYFPFSFSVTGCWSNIYLSEMEPEPLIIYYELSAKLYIL